MKIDFYLRFHTKFGQSLFITGNLGVLGYNVVDDALPMSFLSEDYWHASVELDEIFNATSIIIIFLKTKKENCSPTEKNTGF